MKEFTDLDRNRSERLQFLRWVPAKVKTCMWALVAIEILMIASVANAADWPQYRGPNRDDVSSETGLLKKWPEAGPPLLWIFEKAGVGYSGPAIHGGKLFTLGGRGENDELFALDLSESKTGKIKELWSVRVGAIFEWKGNQWSSGPSSTPTVDGDLVYAIGGFGDLICVEATTGKERWRKNCPKDLGAQVNPIGGGPKGIGWGFSGSPLIDGERLVFAPGGPQGTVAALNKFSGDVIWRSSELTDQAAYTSVMKMEVDGVAQYVVLTNQGVSGVAAKDGKLLWRMKRPSPYGTEVVNSPIVHGSQVFTTVGSGGGCEAVKVTRTGDAFQVEVVYSNKNLSNHHGNVVRIGNHVYGASQGKGWVCLDWDKGEVVWSENRKFGAGAVTFADGHLYCYGENNGLAALVTASSTGWNEVGRLKMPQKSSLRKPSGQVWTPPVVANGQLFLRDQELIFCFDVKEK